MKNNLNRFKQMRGNKFHYPPPKIAFSRDALQRAWLTVKGKKGKSVNGTIVEFERNLDEHLDQLQMELRRGTYMPTPVKRILIPKANAKMRPITLWAVRDRVVQRAVYNYLEPIWEPQFLPCSHGYRPNYSTKTAAHAIQTARQQGATWVLEADIKDCFGSMDNKRLLRLVQQWHVPKPIYTLIDRWLHAKVLNAWQGSPDVAGTSQGGVISPLLCNRYLHTLDRAMNRKEWHLVRYADDFVVLAKTEKHVSSAMRHATSTLKQIGLKIHPQKTRIKTFDEHFTFVGWFFVRDEMYKLK